MHNSILSLLVIFFSLVQSAYLYAAPPEFQQRLGSFAPPDYIPIDVTSDIAGNIYVLDMYHERVRVFDANLSMQREMNFNFKWARGIAVDTAGNIYIADASGTTYGDTGAASILKFTPDGQTLITAWPVTARGISIDANNRIYAASQFTDTVEVFDTEGNLLLSVGNGVLNDPEDAAAGPDGSIYVADAMNSRIVKFDAGGNFVRSWGSFGSNPEQFYNPVAVETDDQGNVFVTDRRNYQIKKFSSDGVLLAVVGAEGWNAGGLFQEPHGIDVDPNGNVWIANYHGHDIQEFDNNLTYLRRIEGRQSQPGEFADVRGVDIDSEHNIYIADKWNQRITKFNQNGEVILTWGKRGQGEGPEFNMPRAIHIDSADNVYISDDGHIRKFDKNGNYITRWGKYHYSRGLTTDRFGFLYIAEPLRNRILKIDQDKPSGAADSVTIIGNSGSGNGQFNDPFGIAIGPNDKLYVADSRNARIQRLSLDGTFELEWGARQVNGGGLVRPTAIAVDSVGNVYVGDASDDHVNVYDADGNYLYQWGEKGENTNLSLHKGTAKGEFFKVYAIAIDEPDLIYVTDVINATVQRFAQPNALPSFNGGTGSFEISENADPGDVITTLIASDPNDTTLTFSITTGNDDESFSIDNSSGIITVAKNLDYETSSNYTLTVMVSDDGGSNATSTVNINIAKSTDINNTNTTNGDGGGNGGCTISNNSATVDPTMPFIVLAFTVLLGLRKYKNRQL